MEGSVCVIPVSAGGAVTAAVGLHDMKAWQYTETGCPNHLRAPCLRYCRLERQKPAQLLFLFLEIYVFALFPGEYLAVYLVLSAAVFHYFACWGGGGSAAV